MGLSDFPRPFIIGVRPSTSRCGLRFSLPQADAGSPGSRTRCFHTCSGSLTARDPSTPCESGAPGVAFRPYPRRRHPGVPAACAAGHGFRGSIPGLYVPLSTLRRRPYERLRMTRGRCGSLLLQRMTLAFTTPCRFLPAHGESHEPDWAGKRGFVAALRDASLGWDAIPGFRFAPFGAIFVSSLREEGCCLFISKGDGTKTRSESIHAIACAPVKIGKV